MLCDLLSLMEWRRLLLTVIRSMGVVACMLSRNTLSSGFCMLSMSYGLSLKVALSVVPWLLLLLKE